MQLKLFSQNGSNNSAALRGYLKDRVYHGLVRTILMLASGNVLLRFHKNCCEQQY
ncbi:hypothetical protein C0J52_13278 [Blattella germanica]|nr:hypothetical protein C0J52_13278 [Blattella germanica]